MPDKTILSQAARQGGQATFSFGGGSETIFAVDDGSSPFGFIIDTGGGDDTIFGSDFTGRGTPSGHDPRTTTGDVLVGGDGSDTILGGAGDDTIYGGNEDGSLDASKGQNPPPENTLVGDGERLADDSLSDTITFLNGSTFDGGDDTLIGGTGATSNTMYGDARLVQSPAGTVFNGGDDTLIGGSGATSNTMFGDARFVETAGDAVYNGGNDHLVAGDGGSNTMVGDAQVISGTGTVNGGDDVLVSGTGNDQMAGDWTSFVGFTGIAIGGADTFVFGVDNGFDSIADFEQGKDKIDLVATGLVWADLDTNNSGDLDNGDDFVAVSGGSTTINLGGAITGDASAFGDQVIVSGVTGLVETDFVFATVLV